MTATIGDIKPDELAAALAGPGLLLDYGAVTMLLRTHSGPLLRQLQRVYAAFPFRSGADFADLHVDVLGARGLRRLFRPQARFLSDGVEYFHPFPADSALPLVEWGANWLIGERLHHRLLFHAGALERDGCTLLLPAVPGSGKSTLTAALSLRGWRLLSDEFGVCDPATLLMWPLLKPVALKNESVDVVRRFEPKAAIGPAFPKTRKGTVAHLAPDAGAVTMRAVPARPGLVVLPKWIAGSALKLAPLGQEEVFQSLAFNSFNYEFLGETGFDAALSLARRCRGWRLEYSDLDEAVTSLDRLWREAMDPDRSSTAWHGGPWPPLSRTAVHVS